MTHLHVIVVICFLLDDHFYLIYPSVYENEEIIALARVWHSVYRPSLLVSEFSSVHGLLPKPTLSVPIVSLSLSTYC